MNDHQRGLANGYLDETLTEAEQAELNSWIKAAPENAAAFADAVRLHDRLLGIFRAERFPSPSETPPVKPPRPWRRIGFAGGAAVAFLLVAVWWGNSPQASAAAELERLIESPAAATDRVYRVVSLDPHARPTESRQPPIDGAILSIRSPDQYVLRRWFPDGREYVTGSDGEVNWDVPPSAPVRLSHDPWRFRTPLPGHQYGIPFVDLRSDLVELRDAYLLRVLAADGGGRRGLLAVKKSREYRGPNRVEIWYDPVSNVIHRMVFDGLPRERGGPKSLAVELLEQRELPADYFKHQAHHAADRRVIEED